MFLGGQGLVRVRRHSHRRAGLAQCVTDDSVTLVATVEDANGRTMHISAELVIDLCNVEPELPGKRWLEDAFFQFDHDVAQLPDVEEQEVNVEVGPVDLKMHLSAHVSETCAELRQSMGDAVR